MIGIGTYVIYRPYRDGDTWVVNWSEAMDSGSKHTFCISECKMPLHSLEAAVDFAIKHQADKHPDYTLHIQRNGMKASFTDAMDAMIAYLSLP